MRPAAAAAAIAIAIVLGGVLLVLWKFPFRRDAVVKSIESQTGARVEIGTFQEKKLPPGFTARQVRLSDAAGDVLTIDSVTLEGSYAGLLRRPKTVGKVRASELHLVIPSKKAKGNRKTFSLSGGNGTGMAVGEIRLDQAVLDFLSDTPGKSPLEFGVHRLVLTNVGPHRAVGFEVSLHNPKPRGEIRSRGEFGPIDMNDSRRTPVSGRFSFEKADLTADHAITGILNASGNFYGPVARLHCTGTADVPNFNVFGSSNPVHVAARFDTTVDALTGNAALNGVAAHFNNTTVSATGNVENEPGRPAKRVTLDLAVHDGRIDDILLLFTSRRVAAMQGPISLRGKFTIPPGPPGFLERLKVEGDFSITHGRFTNPNVQVPVDRLSASGEGRSKHKEREDPTLAAVDFHGHVTGRDGVARLPGGVFEVPGVHGRLAGIFTLRQKKIDMNGTLETSGKLADTTSGLKTLLLKAIGPLWHKQASVKSIPFDITGTASHPVFRLKLRE